eukprot:2814547-Amphidinium_carterae.1
MYGSVHNCVGDPITFLGLDGRPHTSVVPVGAEKSGTFMAWSWTAPIPPPPPTEELLDEELKPCRTQKTVI